MTRDVPMPHPGVVLREDFLEPMGLSVYALAKAIHVMREDFAHPVRIERLAAVASMSPSSFHQHFKAVTSMTPLQYQKQLRLQAARKLLIGRQDAARAAYAVGYESPSQFSREYARLFGAPPTRDAVRLRGDREAQAEIAGAA